jgi:hypothetical protein
MGSAAAGVCLLGLFPLADALLQLIMFVSVDVDCSASCGGLVGSWCWKVIGVSLGPH